MNGWVDVPGLKGTVKINNKRQFLIPERITIKENGRKYTKKGRMIDLNTDKTNKPGAVRITINGRLRNLNYEKIAKEVFKVEIKKEKIEKKKVASKDEILLTELRNKFKITNVELKNIPLWELDFYAENMKLSILTVADAISNVLCNGVGANAR